MKLGLREKLLIPVILTFIAGMSAAITYSYISSTLTIKKEVSSGLKSEVNITVKLMNKWLESRITDIYTWSMQQVYIKAVTEKGNDGKRASTNASRNLANLENGYPYYDYIFLSDLKGNITASSNPADDHELNVADRSYYNESIGGKTCVSEVIISRKTGNKIFVISVPVKKNGKIVGVLAGTVLVSAFKSLFIDDFNTEKDELFFLAEKSGKIIMISSEKNYFNDIRPFEFGKKMLHTDGGILIFELNETTRISCFQKLSKTGWIFSKTESLDKALASSKQTGKFSIFCGIAILFLVIIAVGLLFKRIILSPLDETLKVIKQVEKGKLDVQIKERQGFDEIITLTNAFNTMIQRLRTTLENLTREVHVRKEAELELKKHRENLEEIVKERTIELEREIKERSRVEEKLRQNEKRLQLQNKTLMKQAKNKSHQNGNLKTATQMITKAAAHTLGVEHVSVWIFTNNMLKFYCLDRYSHTTDRHSQGPEFFSSDHSTFIKALENERTIETNGGIPIHQFEIFLKQVHTPDKNVSALFASVWTNRKIAGFICLEHVGEKRAWEIDEVNFAATTADFVALAVETHELNLAESAKKQLEVRLHRAEKMEAIGTLAGGVAHDLNNILSGILSYPELLLMDLPDDSPLRTPISTIRNSGKKAAAIVQDLLTLARRGVSTSEVSNLNALVSDYLKSPEYDKMISFHPGVSIETDLDNTLINIAGSPVHLFKTIMNLVSNAAEAMPEGGVARITTENMYVDKPIRGYDNVAEGDYATLTVSDSGVGILPDDMSRIFEPFYTKKKMGRSGTGLGMAVVWGTVKDHKGYIDCISEEGAGTTFTLYFPVSRLDVHQTKNDISIDKQSGNGEKILIVDDIKEQRLIASAILSRLGYTVETVPSGEEAIEYLKENFADLVVLDMVMDPGIDGLDTYKKIIEFLPGQKAIITSGFSETTRIKEALSIGVAEYIKKPYSIETISTSVRAELDRQAPTPRR